MYAGHEAVIHTEMCTACVKVATCAKRVANLRVSRGFSPEGGGHGPPMPSPPDPPLADRVRVRARAREYV